MKKLGLIVIASMFFAANTYALELKLENKTGKELHELYFAPAGEDEWGPDQLGEQVVANDASFTLQGIPPAKYDVLFVDEHGDKCDLRDVNFTSSETFVMTKSIIKGCQAATDAQSGN